MASVAPADTTAATERDEAKERDEAWTTAGPKMELRPSLSSRVSTPTNGKVLMKGAATLDQAAHIPYIVNSVPVTTYGAVMMLPGLINTTTFYEWFHNLGEAYIRLLMNYIVQGFITVNMYFMYRKSLTALESGPPDCEELEPTLELICLWLHVAACLTDMVETWNMREILWHQIPTAYSHSEVLRYMDVQGSLTLVSGGFSRLRKALVTVFILIPKFAIAVLVLIWGGMYLAASASNSDVLLNCLALTFVIGIDEMIFAFLAPAKHRHIMEALPSFDVAVEPSGRRFLRHGGSIIRTLGSFAVTVLLRFSVRRCGQDGWF